MSAAGRAGNGQGGSPGPIMSGEAWRGLGLLLLAAGTVVALLGAARIERAGAGFQAHPVWPLFGGGVLLLVLAAGLLRWHGHTSSEGGDARRDTRELVTRLCGIVRAVQAGRAAVEAEPLPAALEVLASVDAPAEDAGYVLWLKLQLDPVLDDLFPQLMATRDAFRRRHGLPAFATLFGELAHAERLLSRAWSAAVDGYAAEARSSLDRVSGPLGQVEQRLAELSSAEARIGE